MSPHLIETCPHCGTDLRGEEIPIEDREGYGGKTRFTRLVAMVHVDTRVVTKFFCPDCEKRIDRSTAYRASD